MHTCRYIRVVRTAGAEGCVPQQSGYRTMRTQSGQKSKHPQKPNHNNQSNHKIQQDSKKQTLFRMFRARCAYLRAVIDSSKFVSAGDTQQIITVRLLPPYNIQTDRQTDKTRQTALQCGRAARFANKCPLYLVHAFVGKNVPCISRMRCSARRQRTSESCRKRVSLESRYGT